MIVTRPQMVIYLNWLRDITFLFIRAFSVYPSLKIIYLPNSVKKCLMYVCTVCTCNRRQFAKTAAHSTQLNTTDDGARTLSVKGERLKNKAHPRTHAQSLSPTYKFSRPHTYYTYKHAHMHTYTNGRVPTCMHAWDRHLCMHLFVIKCVCAHTHTYTHIFLVWEKEIAFC